MRPINHAINSLLINDLQDKKFTKIKKCSNCSPDFHQTALFERKKTNSTHHAHVNRAGHTIQIINLETPHTHMYNSK